MNTNTFSLNPEQLSAVNDTEGQVLVIAGAGSGKTRVLTARICHLVEMGVEPYNILAITFTNKAAAEMKERINGALGYQGAGIWTSTFHSMCSKILRIDAERLGYTADYSIYSDVETGRVVKRIIDTISAADAKKKDTYVYHISQAKTYGLSPSEYLNEIGKDVKDADVICTIYARYEDELKKSNALDFDDLLVKTVELFEKCPDVLERYQNRFKYIHVDEFQDTNTIQYKIVKLLAGKWGNLFVVGDEDQSIYSWRGAEIKNILGFNKDFPSAKVYKLEQNYRSTPAILKAANNVIKHNLKRNEKTLWSSNGDVAPVEYFEARTDREEADFVARKINALHLNGENYKDMAILVRVNSITRLFEEAFNLYSIPYKVFGGFRFFERKEIKDALSYVRLAINPSDNDSIARVINYPKRGIGDKAVDDLLAVATARGATLFEVLLNADVYAPQLAKKVAPFVDIATDLVAQQKAQDPVSFMQYVIKRSSLEDFLRTSKDPDDENRLENIQELVSAVQQFMQDNPSSTLSDFMQSVALISDTDEMDETNYVTIATVHAVKGLEFDNVFIVGLEESLFPVQRSIDSGDVEEERRLMYVAITRAKKRLYAISSSSRFRFAQMQYNMKSRFVAEMQGEEAKAGSIRQGSTRGFGAQSTYNYGAHGSGSNYGGAYGGNAYGAKSSNAYGGSSYGGNSYGGGTSLGNSYKVGQTSSAPRPSIRPATTAPKASSIDYSLFKQDTVVEHSKFGRGIIISTSGSGADTTAAIAFKGLGVKRFALSVAAPLLKIVKDDDTE